MVTNSQPDSHHRLSGWDTTRDPSYDINCMSQHVMRLRCFNCGHPDGTYSSWRHVTEHTHINVIFLPWIKGTKVPSGWQGLLHLGLFMVLGPFCNHFKGGWSSSRLICLFFFSRTHKLCFPFFTMYYIKKWATIITESIPALSALAAARRKRERERGKSRVRQKEKERERERGGERRRKGPTVSCL